MLLVCKKEKTFIGKHIALEIKMCVHKATEEKKLKEATKVS